MKNALCRRLVQEKVLTGDQIMKALSDNKQGEKVVQTVTQKAGGR